MTDQQSNQDQPRLQLKTLEIGAGAGAALITAVASSALGVAGTIGGAAVASVMTTVSTSVLRHSAHRTTQTLRRSRTLSGRAAAPATAAANTAAANTANRAADRTVRLATGLADRPGPTYPAGTGWPAGQSPTGWPDAEPPGPADRAEPEHAPPGPGSAVNRKPGRPRWLLLAGASAAVFALAMGGITGIEAAIGRPLSSLFGHGGDGRSSVQQVFGGHSDATPTPKPTGSTPASGGPSTGPAVTPTGQPGQSQPPATSPAPAPPADTGGAGDTGGGTGDVGGAGDQGGVAATP
jgi:hypothetical protein